MFRKLSESDLSISGLVSAVAKRLEAENLVEPPRWAGLVKTGSHAERVPQSPKFWFGRCASALVAVSRRPVGVRRLRNKYGGRTSNTLARSHHRKAGGKAVRLPLQQLEKVGLVKKARSGRVITPAGKAFIAKAAAQAGLQ